MPPRLSTPPPLSCSPSLPPLTLLLVRSSSPPLHRDIKPDNLLVTRLNRILKIADFGTACFTSTSGSQSPSGGATVGTPPFMSPELCTKESSGLYEGAVIDLWAAGVTLYMWLSGRLPFEAPTEHLLMQAIAAAPEQVAPPAEAGPPVATVSSQGPEPWSTT